MSRYYFAFEQTYFDFLFFPSGLGILAWALLPAFHIAYGIAISLWCIVFVEWWQHQERELAIRWGVRRVGSIESRRSAFQPTHELQDPATGTVKKYFPPSSRFIRQTLNFPFAALAVLVPGSLITLCFAVEVFLAEVYNGPGQAYLVFAPSIGLALGLPMLTGPLSKVAEWLTSWENYETHSDHSYALTAKLFVLDFTTSYMALFVTAFIYTPFGRGLASRLEISNWFGHEVSESSTGFQIDRHRLRDQVISFALTSFLANFGTEVVLPYARRWVFGRFRELRQSSLTRTESGFPTIRSTDPNDTVRRECDREEDPVLLPLVRQARIEAALPDYDVATDLREMVVQFGYLSLFGIVWPLVPLSLLINNWFELRTDAIKICVDTRRPLAARVDSIGPWLNALGFLTWLGSLTMAALVYMFDRDDVESSMTAVERAGLLLAVFCSEHVYLLAHQVVRYLIANIDSPGRQKERLDRHRTREKLFRESRE